MDMDTSSQRTKSPNTVPLIAALCAAIVGVYLLVASTYDRSSAVISSTPPPTYEVIKDRLLDYASVVAVTGFDSASGLFIPTLLALFPLATRKYRRAALLLAAGLTLAVCLVWPLSIGALYLPTALLLLFAAARTNEVSAHAI
jgi:hypothetical protein